MRVFAVAPLLFLALNAVATETPTSERTATRVILVGDSTMATRTGYGDALCKRFLENVTCINLARGGRSSGSFRTEGLWEQMMDMLRTGGQFRATYVLIQFGHNDQPGKPGRSTDLVSEFPVNMARYVEDARSLGAVPVLVTPLTRRIFRDGVLQNDLKAWADATRRIADAKKAPLLDLNADSAAAVSAMGTSEADTLAEEPPPAKPVTQVTISADVAKLEPNGVVKSRFDYTHLGAKGAALFSRMVAQELVTALPALAVQIKPDAIAK
ncbi:MAG: rhamnogalacturonan acetylesterase [Betaproteobacteria bacterium]